jgi:hypothetical protein
MIIGIHEYIAIFMNFGKLWVYCGFYKTFCKCEIIKKIKAFSSHIKYNIPRF